MAIKTIHGCTCKPKYKFRPEKYPKNKVFKGCSFGSGTKKCQIGRAHV